MSDMTNIKRRVEFNAVDISVVHLCLTLVIILEAEAECKKRWRSLRDSFIKLQRTHGGRTRWPYHYAMKFLLPHVEPKDGYVGSITSHNFYI